MRKVIVSLIVLSLLPALATAAVTNPEGFETYALTTDWQPTQAVDGWETDILWRGEVADVPDGNLPWWAEIKVSEVAPNTSQVQSVTPRKEWPKYGQGGLVSTWYQSFPDSGGPITRTSWDIAPVNQTLGDQWLMHVSRVNDDSLDNLPQGGGLSQAGNQSWQVGIVSMFVTPDYCCLDPLHANTTYLQCLTDEGTWVEEEITGIDMDEFGPPGSSQDPGPGYNWNRWWTCEVEEDNVLSKTRARIYEKGTSPGDEEGWTSWLDHHSSIHGLDYSTGGKVVVRSQGEMEYDNFSMTQGEGPPASLPGDANNDGLVSADDYASVQGHFGDTGAVNIPGDANLDGLVSADDYASVQSNFGNTAGVPVPEPATMLLLAIGGVVLLKRRSRASR